jgi:hypothetical protein
MGLKIIDKASYINTHEKQTLRVYKGAEKKTSNLSEIKSKTRLMVCLLVF